MEIWKDIEGFEGLYKISNYGNILSFHKNSSGILRKPKSDKGGYHFINLAKEGTLSIRKIHRLVAEAFIPNPENKPQVNHKNGVKTYNYVDNLEWCTNQENNIHAWDSGFRKVSEETKRKMSKNHGRHNRRKVIDSSSGITYDSIRDCAKAIGLNSKTLTSRLSGHLKNNTTIQYCE